MEEKKADLMVRMMDWLSDVSLEEKKADLMERMMDWLSGVSWEEKKGVVISLERMMDCLSRTYLKSS